jgi:chemosensory pili system protein ChpA (sensor histidine kinase/response regulator)
MTSSILLVEDDEAIRFTLEMILRQEGYKVVIARDGEEALEKLRSLRLPALVLLDLTMPRVDGWTVLKQMREDERLAPVPVIVTSAVADPRLLIGANEIVDKPYDFGLLLRLIRKYCGHVTDA